MDGKGFLQAAAHREFPCRSARSLPVRRRDSSPGIAVEPQVAIVEIINKRAPSTVTKAGFSDGV